MKWQGVLPAITTPFDDRMAIDHSFLARHVAALLDAGSTGIVALGSLGEGGCLSLDEKLAVLRTCVEASKGRAPVVAGVAAMTTAEAVEIATAAETVGCQGLMVLPPYVYRGDGRETQAHFSAVIEATELSCLLYNNPIAYGTDVLPEAILALAARHANLDAVKESSADIRRVTEIRALATARQRPIEVLVGVDDLIVEGIAAGATGWIAGLVNALPGESIELFEHAIAGRSEEARRLYEWFLPLLRLDTVPKFVQLIKLVQQEVGLGSERVRPPRLPLEGGERQAVLDLVRNALAARPENRTRA
jgi:4-hydroxy-tetrahydrodipicolinate synthase